MRSSLLFTPRTDFDVVSAMYYTGYVGGDQETSGEQSKCSIHYISTKLDYLQRIY